MRKALLLGKEKPAPAIPDVIAIAVLMGFVAFFYRDFLMGTHFIWEDTLTEFYPGINYFARAIHAGRFPLWFPGVHDGMPFYSDPQMSVFYPLQWLLVPFVHNGRLPFLVYQRYIILHYALGGVLMYLFLKQLKLSPIAGLTGALVFSLSGFPSLRVVNFVMIQVYVWLPLQLMCVHRLTERGGRWAWLGFVGAALMSLLAGHQQTTVYCWYLVAAYWLYRSWCSRRKVAANWRATIWQVATVEIPRLIATFLLVVGLGAVMVLPAIQNWSHTGRSRQPFVTVADTSLPRDQLLTLLVPRFFGESLDGGSPRAFWGYDRRSPTVMQTGTYRAQTGYWQYWEFGAYAGQLFWISIFLLLFNWRCLEKKAAVGFFLVVWLASVWFMLGRYGGLFQALYYSLPGASLFRGPAKMSCVATFAAAVLCAQAIEFLKYPAAVSRFWPAWLPAAVCACLCLVLFSWGKHFGVGLSDADKLSWALHESLFALAAGALCALAVHGTTHVRRSWGQTFCLWAIPLVLFVDFYHSYADFQCGAENPDVFYPQSSELLSFIQDYHRQYHPFRFAQIIRDKVREELTCPRNLAYFHDFLEVPEGYTSFYLDSVARFQNITNRAAKLGIQNVALATEFDSQGNSWVDIITNSLPRAKFFSRIHQSDSRTTLLGELERCTIDWNNEIAVVKPVGTETLRQQAQFRQRPIAADVVQFKTARPETYSLKYKVSQPGIIFVSQSFYPGWVANDGRLKIVEVFGAFQGLVIPEPGSGRIVVHFSPPVLRLGIVVSVLSLFLTGVAAFAAPWSKLHRD
ncbi:MAG TPA: YfhO family protein [Verrucomicrobiae bacterium]|nr:YfhO family protein [Verrucomicrobiae bacterium]